MPTTDSPGDAGPGGVPGPEGERARPGTSAGFQAHVRAARSEFEHQIDRARADFEEVNDRINARTGRNLLMATLIGLAVGAVVLGSLLFIKWLFLVFAIPVCLLGVFEFSRALQTAGRRVDVWPQVVAGAVIMLSAFFAGHLTHWALTFGAVAAVIVWRLLAQMIASDGRRYGDVLGDVLIAGFLPLYVPFLASLALVLLRQEQGEYWVLGMLIAVVAADTGAYASGLAFGAHPMAPRISPKKTWAGAIGGTMLSIGVAIGFALSGLGKAAPLVLLAVVLTVLSQIGDLFESAVKRRFGVKDSGQIIPGHGGLLDRLDGYVFAVVAAAVIGLLRGGADGVGRGLMVW